MQIVFDKEMWYLMYSRVHVIVLQKAPFLFIGHSIRLLVGKGGSTHLSLLVSPYR